MMAYIIKNINNALIAICLVLTACNGTVESIHDKLIQKNQEPVKLDRVDYLNDINTKKESLTTSTKIGDLTLSVTYTPVDKQALMIFGRDNEDGHNDSAISDFIRENKDAAYFTFSMINNRMTTNKDLLKEISTGPGDYYKKLEYFSFGMQKDLSLIVGRDTLSCNLFHYERGYDAKPNATFVLCFDLKGIAKASKESDYIFSYADNLFGFGRINLRINKETIDFLPKLKL